MSRAQLHIYQYVSLYIKRLFVKMSEGRYVKGDYKSLKGGTEHQGSLQSLFALIPNPNPTNPTLKIDSR